MSENNDVVFSHIARTVRVGQQPGSYKKIAEATGVAQSDVQEAVRDLIRQGTISATKGSGQFASLVYRVLGEDREPEPNNVIVADGVAYSGIVEINSGAIIPTSNLRTYEERVLEINQAARLLATGKSTAKERQALVDWGMDPARVAEVHLNAIEKRGHRPSPIYVDAMQQLMHGSMGRG